MQNNSIKGIFLIRRDFGNNVSLQNKNTQSQEMMDYFKFKDNLMYYFPIDKVNIILEHINCGRKILIDFDKKVAKLIVEKDYDFKKVLDIYFDPKNVEAELNNPFEDQDIYSRFQTL